MSLNSFYFVRLILISRFFFKDLFLFYKSVRIRLNRLGFLNFSVAFFFSSFLVARPITMSSSRIVFISRFISRHFYPSNNFSTIARKGSSFPVEINFIRTKICRKKIYSLLSFFMLNKL